jgi:ribosomal protein S18 acetylase RimI-like enzyme
MTAAVLRRATVADLDAIDIVVHEAYRKYVDRIGREPAPMDADYAELLSGAIVWVLDSPDGVQGVLVTHVMSDHLFVETVAVASTAQRRGYGAMLLKRAECDAREAGLDEIRLYTNVAMIENLTFYPKHGYAETGRRREDGYDRVYFAKSLGSQPERALSHGLPQAGQASEGCATRS